jgi:hypothetical protein
MTGISSRLEGLGSVAEWLSAYRDDLGLPVIERGGWIELPIAAQQGALHMPAPLGVKVLAALHMRMIDAPVLARRHQTPRWTFLVEFDSDPSHEHELELDLLGVGVQPCGSSLLLPTGLSERNREGCWWIERPTYARLPPLSEVVATTLRLGAPEVRNADAVGPQAQLWLFECADCEAEPADLTPAKARYILQVHARHRPCRQSLGALAYLSQSDD